MLHDNLRDGELLPYQQILAYSREQEGALLAEDLDEFYRLAQCRDSLQQELVVLTPEEAYRLPADQRTTLIAILQQTIQHDEQNKRRIVARLKEVAGLIRQLDLQQRYLHAGAAGGGAEARFFDAAG